MAVRGKPDTLALRVVDNLQGGEIIGDLPHIHQATWQVRALQQGMPGSSTLGTFTILLPPPRSSEFRRFKPLFDLLDMTAGKLRIEGYLGGRVTGSPRFSGVVTGGDRPLDGPWLLTGVDTLWMLQQSQVLPGEVVGIGGAGAPEAGGTMAARFFGTQEGVFDDDFSSLSLSSYTSSNWAITLAGFKILDPVMGLGSIKCVVTSPTEANAVTNTTWSKTAQFTSSSVSVKGVIVAGTDATVAGNVGVWLLTDSTAQNGLLIDVISAFVSVNAGYTVTVTVRQRTAGTFATVAGPITMFTGVPATFIFDLTAIYSLTTTAPNASGVAATIRVLLNGQDAGITTQAFTPPASGGVGVRSSPNAGGAPLCYVSRIQFHARNTAGSNPANPVFGTARFQGGNNTFAGATTLGETITGLGQTHLDVIGMAMTFDGFAVRKRPGFGYKADTIDYGNVCTVANSGMNSTVGTDYSSTIALEEGVNILAQGTRVGTVPELLGTDVRLNSIPGGMSGGAFTWSRIAASGDPVLIDTVSDMGIQGFSMLVQYARQIQARKVNPIQAVQVRVIRDDRWLSVNNGAGPREWDLISVFIPSLNVQRQIAMIVGYDFVEDAQDMVVYLTALPGSGAPGHLVQRVIRTSEYLCNTYKPR